VKRSCHDQAPAEQRAKLLSRIEIARTELRSGEA
jgi:hypothetical protein